MKKGILIIIMLMWGTISNGQIVDNTLSSRVESLERLTKDLNESNKVLNNNLDVYQDRRKFGIGFLVMGFVASTCGYTILATNTEHYATNSTSAINALIITGGVSATIGTVILLDSGKWITNKNRRIK